jgi:hypothetical protein
LQDRFAGRETCRHEKGFQNGDHEWAVGLASRASEPLLACEAVLAETAFHLQSVEITLAMERSFAGEVEVRTR